MITGKVKKWDSLSGWGFIEDDEGNVHNHNLRGRLVSNNGISAMLGLSSSNKSSTPVFKVQQDRVDKVIDNLVKKNIATKWR